MTRQSRILIVEDDHTSRHLLQHFLAKHGYDTIVACNAGQALSVVSRETVDAILMDIMLPDADGLAITAEIRRIEREHRRARIPIIAVTGLDVAGHRDACLAAGTDEYLTKPVSAAQIAAVLERYLQTAV
jgi:CheY-like chemotaxis protein